MDPIRTKFYISNKFNGAVSEHKRILHGQGYNYEEFPDQIIEAFLSEPFITGRMKVLARASGFMLYGKVGLDFFAAS